MGIIAQLCDDIVGNLTRIGSPIAKFLLPGLEKHEIGKIEDTLPCILPNSVVDLYLWRNGSELVPGTTFFPWWHFDTIAESDSRYRVLCDPSDDNWNDHLFPLFSASDVSSLGIACGDQPSDDGPISRFEYMTGTEVEYASLGSMLQTLREAYLTNTIFMGPNGRLDYDEAAFARIARKFNPGVSRWHS